MRALGVYLRDVLLTILAVCVVGGFVALYWSAVFFIYLFVRLIVWKYSVEMIEKRLFKTWRHFNRKPWKAPKRDTRAPF